MFCEERDTLCSTCHPKQLLLVAEALGEATLAEDLYIEARKHLPCRPA